MQVDLLKSHVYFNFISKSFIAIMSLTRYNITGYVQYVCTVFQCFDDLHINVHVKNRGSTLKMLLNNTLNMSYYI